MASMRGLYEMAKAKYPRAEFLSLDSTVVWHKWGPLPATDGKMTFSLWVTNEASEDGEFVVRNVSLEALLGFLAESKNDDVEV